MLKTYISSEPTTDASGNFDIPCLDFEAVERAILRASPSMASEGSDEKYSYTLTIPKSDTLNTVQVLVKKSTDGAYSAVTETKLTGVTFTILAEGV